MLFVLGVVLLLAGCALLLLGRVRLASDLVFSSRASRRAGAVFVAFFPLAVGVRVGVELVGWEVEVVTTAGYWCTFAACLLAGLCLLAAGREATHGVPEPTPPAGPWKRVVVRVEESPPEKPDRSPAASEQNPFDFS